MNRWESGSACGMPPTHSFETVKKCLPYPELPISEVAMTAARRTSPSHIISRSSHRPSYSAGWHMPASGSQLVFL